MTNDYYYFDVDVPHKNHHCSFI